MLPQGQDTDDSAAVPQCEPLNDKQVRNAAGGFAWQLDNMARLRRFLIIGSEGGTYYVTEQRLTLVRSNPRLSAHHVHTHPSLPPSSM